MSERGDLGLTLPLEGVCLLEASAGTGKTFVLATLYTRAVIEARLPVDALLAVTFTEAATQELRLRIRERLRMAQRFAEGEPADPRDPKETSTQALVEAALQAGEARPLLRARLRAAAEAMDLAPVFTIHQFCRRALAEHALEAGQTPGEVELIANEAALREEVATDLWRAVCADAQAARTLASLWPSPAALAEGLRELWSIEALLPLPAASDAAAEHELHARFAAVTATLVLACEQLGEATCSALRGVLATGALHKGTHKPERVERILATLRSWAGDGAGEPTPEDLDVVGSRRLAKAVTGKFVGKVSIPTNALTDAVDDWLVLRAELDALAADRRIALLHRLRDEGQARLKDLKRRRRLQGFDDLVRDLADALEGPRGERLAQRLREQYRVALVDEFQDTDPRQWAIFRRVFAQAPPDGRPRALFLIGDPKQAIYRFRGGDVFTYLEARETATEAKSLYRNFRSRPLALRAVQTLYARAGLTPFGQDDIDFVQVDPGGNVDDTALTFDGRTSPALEVLTWGEDEVGSAEAARERAAIGCVARIRELLEAGRVRRDGEPLAPGDIAVLVASHREGRLMQRQLARTGVPSVAAGRDSLYDSDEAVDLLTVLQACLQLADDARLRAALATPLLGLTASDIARLDEDGALHRGWQDRALAWRERWERHGPLALVNDLCAAAAPRLLALEEGERRLANWLQLGEALQAECAGRDPAACARHLAERIARADSANDEELLRLESDAARVKVLTLHASKGLEFPLVFLPFLSHAGGGLRHREVAIAHHHRAGIGRVGHVEGNDAAAWKAACEAEKAEAAAERLRLLYVGLTRARLATFVGFGSVRDVQKSAFATLLFGGAPPAKLDAPTLRARLEALAADAPDAIVVRSAAAQLPTGAAPLVSSPPLPPAAQPRRVLSRDWGLHSFSALVREAGGGEARRAADEAEPALVPHRFAGARFGNVLHAALENVDFAAWRGWDGDAPPPGQGAALEKALREGNWSATDDVVDGVALLVRLVRETLNAALPEGGCLADLAPEARRAELEFHFALAPTAIDELLALLHANGLVQARSGFGLRARLEGLLTGFVDLVYERDGRIHLLDYKSNWLPAYDDEALAEAMRQGEYDLQYLLYTLALHRWLRLRRPGYDYERDFGGVRYLFCRGLVAGSTQGVYAARPPFALIDALDRMFAGGRQ